MSIVDLKTQLFAEIEKYSSIEKIEIENNIRIVIKPTITKNQLLTFLEFLYVIETKFTEEHANNILLDLRQLDIEILAEAIRFSINRDDLVDSLMILNIINLVKISNTLDDSFFENEDVYFKSIEDLIDIKFDLMTDLNEFVKKLSIYFISLFKSYNKISFTTTEQHYELPLLYRTIFSSVDLLTLSGIFTICDPFSTEECIYIDNSLEYLIPLLSKSVASINLMNSFLESLKDDN